MNKLNSEKVNSIPKRNNTLKRTNNINPKGNNKTLKNHIISSINTGSHVVSSLNKLLKEAGPENKSKTFGGIVMLNKLTLDKKYKKECTPQDIEKIKQILANPKLLDDFKYRKFHYC